MADTSKICETAMERKIKTVFFLDYPAIRGVDCRFLKNGNPGIGGSPFALLALLYLLQENYAADFDISLYTQESEGISDAVKTVRIRDFESALIRAENDKTDIFISQYNAENLIMLQKYRHYRLKHVIWAGNFIYRQELTFLAKISNIARIVCVGREQLDLYRDHPAFKKSTFIYNGIFLHKEKLPEYNQRPNEVTYVGSLIPCKGFHILAKAWKQIIAAVPDAKLNVIGKGNLYDKIIKLGSFGLASQDYEKEFIPCLTDNNGKLLPSVQFFGNLGTEKKEILQKTKVGVPNPSGISETFCISAIEMQAEGCLIATKKCPAYLDTVFRNGILIKRECDLADAVVALLHKKDNDYEQMYSWLNGHFEYYKIASEWKRLLHDIFSDKPVVHEKILKNPDFNAKYLRELNRKIKEFLPFGFQLLPTVLFYTSLFSKIHQLFSRKK